MMIRALRFVVVVNVECWCISAAIAGVSSHSLAYWLWALLCICMWTLILAVWEITHNWQSSMCLLHEKTNAENTMLINLYGKLDFITFSHCFMFLIFDVLNARGSNVAKDMPALSMHSCNVWLVDKQSTDTSLEKEYAKHVLVHHQKHKVICVAFYMEFLHMQRYRQVLRGNHVLPMQLLTRRRRGVVLHRAVDTNDVFCCCQLLYTTSLLFLLEV